MNNLRLFPSRWFAPRESSVHRDDLPGMPARNDMENFFQNMFSGMVTPWEAMNEFMPFWRHQRAQAAILPNLDLTSDEKSYALRIELPGVEPENVSVEVRENALIISGEKKRDNADEQKNQHVLERVYGSFQRVLALPEDADTQAVTASHKNGVLTVSIPRKVPAKAQARSIEITRE